MDYPGKSTTVGHLIFNLGGISDRHMRKLQTAADEQGKSSFGFAYYLDTNKEERQRGLTIKSNTKDFYTDKYITASSMVRDVPILSLVLSAQEVYLTIVSSSRPQGLHQKYDHGLGHC